jgi:small-conductance mechanosensitive channel
MPAMKPWGGATFVGLTALALLVALGIAAPRAGASGAPGGPPDSIAAPAPPAALAAAADSLALPPTASESQNQPAPASRPIYLGGATLFEIRDPVGYPTLDARAASIQTRLLDAARDETLALDRIEAERMNYGARMMLGERLLFYVTRHDVAPGDTSAAITVAESLVPAVRSGIERERSRFRPLYLARSGLIALAILAAFAFLARLALRLGRRASAFAASRAAGLLGRTPVRSIGLLDPSRLKGAIERLGDLIVAAALLVVGYVVLSLVFSLFPWTQGWSHRLAEFAIAGLRTAWNATAAALPRFAAIAAILYIANHVIGFVGSILDAAGRGNVVLPGLHPELAKPTKQLVRVFLWAGTIAIIYPLVPGSDTVAFRGVSVLLGAVVSLGSTGLIQDLLAGLVLIYSRSYRVGERIGTSDAVGVVVSLGLVTTRLRTIKNEEVTISNSQVLRSSATNYSRLAKEGSGLILHTSVTIGYDSPWRTVHRLLIEAALATEGIEAEPAPFVLQRSLGDFYIEYEINATTRDANRAAVLYGLLHQNIQDSFQRGGVEIMSPHYRSLRDGNASTIPATPDAPPAPKGPGTPPSA